MVNENSGCADAQRGRDFLQVTYPILCGAMTWVSTPPLVSAVSRAGAFGILACGALEPKDLKDAIDNTAKMAEGRPFGVNLIVMHPQLQELIEVCKNAPISHVVLAGGLPTKAMISTLQQGGKRVMGFTPTLAVGKRMVRDGIDALIIEGSEAGGHIGPVATSVLAQEILPYIRDVPIFVAGGIGRGEAIAQYLRMGASGCQLGTRFVCALESPAHPHFKKVFIRSHARDAVPTVQIDERFPVIPVRAIRNEGSRAFLDFQKDVIQRHQNHELSKEEAHLAIERYWAGALRRAVCEGDIEQGSLMAGQSVGMVTQEQSTAEIIEELWTQTQSALNAT